MGKNEVAVTVPMPENLPKLQMTDNALITLRERYLRKNEAGEVVEKPEERFWAMAWDIASQETDPANVARYAREFYGIMARGEFMPNSPAIMNSGKGNSNAYGACFVLPIEDSIEGIFSTVKNTALVQKAGGGTGFSFDRLRPTGDYIKSSSGNTSGPMSFWRVLAEATNSIQQGSMRRGANMGMMSITHPDILKFIFAKQDLTVFTNYNVSVKIPDAWMSAYKSDPDAPHVVINQRNGKKFFLPKNLDKMTYPIQNLIPASEQVMVVVDTQTGDVSRVVAGTAVWTMREIFASIIDCAWRTGEPGLFFIDAANRYNPTPKIGDYEATNPCVVGETPILTDEGYHRIDSLVGQSVNIWNGSEWSAVTPEVTGEHQDILLVKLSDGSEHQVTKYHKYPIMTNTDTRRPKEVRLEAQELVPGMRIMPFDYPVLDGVVSIADRQAYTMGFFSGDGSTHSERDVDSIWLYGEKKGLLDKLLYKNANDCGGDRIHVGLDNTLSWQKTFIPYNQYTVQTRLSWLAGLIDSDGSVTNDGGVQIWSVNREFLMGVKRMLFMTGVGSSLLLGKEAEDKMMPDGQGGTKEYHCQKSWRLCIPLWAVAALRSAGLETYRVDTSMEAKYYTNVVKVVSVEPYGQAEKVYCFSEPKNHTGTFDCVVLCNCGEQVLLPYESCNLGSINVSKFLKNGLFDWGSLGAVVETSCRFLDNVVDASPYPIPEIEKMCVENRKIGLGLMGFADLLFQMQIPYNSEAAVTFGGKLMAFIQDTSLKASTALAEEKGVFPNYTGSLWEKDSILGPARLMRNAVTTTVAPTGTISIFANCSGGIEPLFNLFFFRQVLNGKTLKEINEVFLKVAKDRGFYSQELMDKILADGTLAHVDGVPEDVKRVFVCSHDISPEWHIRMQAAFQENCGSSISKTINLTHEATRADVEKAYIMAWEMGCKGITVYRDGCRSNQPMSLKKEEKKVEVVHESKRRSAEEWKPRRPVKTAPFLPAVRMKQSTPLGTMHITITVDPVIKHEVEIFAQLGKAGETAASDLEAICRMVSMYLRLGGSIVDVIDQFDGIGSNMSIPTKDGKVQSLADGLAKSLRVYHMAKGKFGLEALLLGKVDTSKLSLKAGLGDLAAPVAEAPVAPPEPKSSAAGSNAPSGAGKCPNCGGKMNKSQGCLQCSACGFSKCG